jgi:hypothetical protein
MVDGPFSSGPGSLLWFKALILRWPRQGHFDVCCLWGVHVFEWVFWPAKTCFFVIWKFGSEMCDNDPYHCFGHRNNQSNSCKSYSVVHERSVDKGEINILIGNINPLIRKLQIKISLQRDRYFFSFQQMRWWFPKTPVQDFTAVMNH